ncbi:MAG TPA: hypothetical protein VFX47_05125 [Gammaproteobacteria bacterium]|nr:hypothetical protein [Gammaproteobacteria bacterium]
MFVGHYGVAFAARRIEKRIPLWLFFIAVQFVDILWCMFILLGIEKVRIAPGITAANPLDFYYFPYTHSLIGNIGWAGVAFVLYRVSHRYKGSPKPALILALAVLSHWFLDLLVHTRDLDIINENFKVGFGLWNYPVIELILELAILFGGLAYYLRGNIGLSKSRKIGMIVFAVILAGIQLVNTFAPAPTSVTAIGIAGLVMYGILALAAFFLEPHKPQPGVEQPT